MLKQTILNFLPQAAQPDTINFTPINLLVCVEPTVPGWTTLANTMLPIVLDIANSSGNQGYWETLHIIGRGHRWRVEAGALQIPFFGYTWLICHDVHSML